MSIVWFESYWAGMKTEVGGKASSLGEMTGAGLPVPPGFAISTAAYRRARDESDLDAQIARLLHGLDVSDTDMLTDRCGQIRQIIRSMPIPEGIELQIRGAYLELSARAGGKEIPVAVRSSASRVPPSPSTRCSRPTAMAWRSAVSLGWLTSWGRSSAAFTRLTSRSSSAFRSSKRSP